MQTVSQGSPDYLLCTQEALFFIFRGILGGGISEQIGFYGPSFPLLYAIMAGTHIERRELYYEHVALIIFQLIEQH